MKREGIYPHLVSGGGLACRLQIVLLPPTMLIYLCHSFCCVVFSRSYIQNVILDEGDQFAGLLYSWRSLSRAVPAVSLTLSVCVCVCAAMSRY